MQETDTATIGRRRLLGLIAAGGLTAGLAGCSGGADSDESGTATPAGATPTAGGMPTADGSASGQTSLAGSCGAAFGDTDQRYDPGDRGLLATFSYPMGGTVYFEDSSRGGYVTTIGYDERSEGQYAQTLRVSQRGPYGEGNVGERYAARDDWEDGGTVTYDGGERAVAVKRTEDFSVIWLFGVPGPDGTYELEVQASVGIGEECPGAYGAVCERVARSFEPVSE